MKASIRILITRFTPGRKEPDNNDGVSLRGGCEGHDAPNMVRIHKEIKLQAQSGMNRLKSRLMQLKVVHMEFFGRK